MKLYLVREAGTMKVHGIFWAANATALWEVVNEMADPVRFQWAEITDFGGVWREDDLTEALLGPDRSAFSPGEEGDQAFDDAYSKALSFGFSHWSEYLLEMIAGQDEHGWQRFDAADEGVGMIARVLRRERARAHGAGRGEPT